MMKHIRKLLLDALLACQALQRSTIGVTFEQYAQNEEKQAAVERWLILIGEALNQASVLEPALSEQIPELRQIVGMRNRLVHAYDQTDQEIVWDVIWTKMPELRTGLERMLPDDVMS